MEKGGEIGSSFLTAKDAKSAKASGNIVVQASGLRIAIDFIVRQHHLAKSVMCATASRHLNIYQTGASWRY